MKANASSWPKIRKRVHRVKAKRGKGKKYTYWVVDFGVVNGKRSFKNFKSEALAQAHAQEKRNETRQLGIEALVLTDAHKRDAITGLKILDGHGTLTRAAEFYMKHSTPPGGKRTVSQLLEEYLEAKRKANRRPETLTGIKYRIGKLAEDYGATPVHEVTRDDLERWLDRKGYRQVSLHNFITALRGFFKYAQGRKLVVENPAALIEKPKLDEKEPRSFTVAEVEKLMAAAVKHDESQTVPYFALCLFAGLRPAEAKQLDWSRINLDTRRITVLSPTAKLRRRRFVDISDNLLEWLLPHRQEQGGVYCIRKHLEKVVRDSKVKWSPDVMRHTYGSFYLAHHEDAAKTALQMGNSVDVVFHHYRDLVTRESAAEFWEIRPNAGKEVQFKKATA